MWADLLIGPAAFAVLCLLAWLVGLCLPTSYRLPTLRELRRGRCWHVVHVAFGLPDLVMSRHFTPAAAARALKANGLSGLEVVQAPRKVRRRSA